MYSLITKIAHSTALKDTIAVARGLYRVASHTPQNLNGDWQGYLPTGGNQQPRQTLEIRNTLQHKTRSISENLQHLTPNSTDPLQKLKEQVEGKTVEQVDQKIATEIPQSKASQAQSKELKQKWSAALDDNARQESKMISSRFGRIFEYGKLGKWMLETQVEAYVARNLGHGNEQQVYERGAHKITGQLCKMRGAPLKVAQMLSIQEDNLIPAPIRKAFEKAREQAHVMPQQEVEQVMASYLGSEWQDKFKSFQMKPFAAASIGQVHKAISHVGEQFAVKLQYPGVEKSIHSDMKNLKMLLKLPGVLPKGIFLDKLLANTEKELSQQCDYQRQAQMHELYDKCLQSVMGDQYSRFAVPKINKEISQRNLLVSQFLSGIRVSRFEEDKVPQEIRDDVGRLLMKLTFKQIFEMGIMQSDPNPSNFTFNVESKKLNLFDFGATHIYNQTFLNHYCKIINASVESNKEEIVKQSILTGFLTNEENAVMLENHIQSIMVLGEPLRWKGIYDFGNQAITQKIYKTIPLLLKNRLKSPPEQIYSLHRKLSGSYLACIRMRSRVDCQKIYSELIPNYKIQSFI